MSFLSYTRDFHNNLLMLLLRDHKRYMPIVTFFETMTQNLSELNWSETELIAAEVSKVNQSGFCSGLRSGMTKALNADASELKNTKLATALTFALKINQNPNDITQQDIDEVVDAGWSEQTVEDIVGLVAIQSLYNIISNGLGFRQLPEGAFIEIANDTVNKGGYTASFKQYIKP